MSTKSPCCSAPLHPIADPDAAHVTECDACSREYRGGKYLVRRCYDCSNYFDICELITQGKHERCPECAGSHDDMIAREKWRDELDARGDYLRDQQRGLV